jgi:uncharacterized protein
VVELSTRAIAGAVAVVGLSRDPEKVAHAIPGYLEVGRIPQHSNEPAITHVLGETSRRSLREITAYIDLVQLSGPAPEAAAIAADAVAIGAESLWLQQGIRSRRESSRFRLV